MSTPTLLGKVAATPKGTWSAANGYEILDIVTHGGSGYISLQNVPAGIQITNTSYWLKFCSKGDKGDGGEIVSASANVDDTYGTPAVSVTMGGTAHERSFVFSFSHLKGNGIVSVEKTDTSGSVDTYTVTYDSGETTEFTVTNGSVTSVNGRTGDVTGLAEQDGYYTSLTAGTAEQILSTVSVNDKAPYLLRTSGGNADIGNRELDKIIGGTIVWNQLVKDSDVRTSTSVNGVTFTNNGDGSLNISGTATDNVDVALIAYPYYRQIINHVYLAIVSGISDPATFIDNQKWFTYAGGYMNGTNYLLQKESGNSERYFSFRAATGYSVDETVRFERYDLTQMFGSTIADYICSLEQSHAGDGMAFVKPFIENADKSYNAGELVSVKTSAHETVGFNQWDEQTQLGQLRTADGTINTALTDRLCSLNYIPIVPNTVYYAKTPQYFRTICYYDKNKNYLNKYKQYVQNQTFTTPEDAYYMRFDIYTEYGTTYNHDICINLSWSGYRNGEYEPYVKHTYALDSDLELRGVLKLDANNKLYYDGDIYESDGTVTRKYGVYTFTGSEQTAVWADGLWSVSGAMPGHVIPVYTSVPINAVSDGFSVVPYNKRADNIGARLTVAPQSSTYPGVVIIAGAETVAETLAMFAGKTIVYELASPATESADPYTNPQIVDDFGTERYVDERDVPVPVGHDTDYLANLRDKLQRLPGLPESDGLYIVKYASNNASYIPVGGSLDEDGAYTLSCTVTDGVPVFSWIHADGGE